MKTKTKESATVRACRAQLRKRLKAVGAERDKLRELAHEYKMLAGTCDDAWDAIESAIEALSRYA